MVTAKVGDMKGEGKGGEKQNAEEGGGGMCPVCGGEEDILNII